MENAELLMRQLKIDVLSVLVVTDKWEFGGKLFEARDFSPGYMHRDFGTKVPCSDNAKANLSLSPSSIL